jgi:hypothetical protein
MQNELADLRTAWQEHGQATEAFKSSLLKDMQAKSDGTASELNNQLKDIEAESDATTLQLKDRLDGLVSKVLEHTTRLDGFTPLQAAVSGLSNLRQEMQNDLTEVRQGHGRSSETLLNNRLKDIEAKNDSTASQLKDWLDGLVSQVLEKTMKLEASLIPRVEAVESKLSAELVEASLCSLSNLRQEMQTELADLRTAWPGDGQAIEDFKSAVLKDIETKIDALALGLNNQLKDIEAKSGATAAQLKDRFDGLVSQVLEKTTKLEASWTQHVEAVETQFSTELATSQGRVQASLSSLPNLMQNELADLRTAWQEHGQATEAFKSSLLKDIEAKSGAAALELNNQLKDIETKSSDTAAQLKFRLDVLVLQVLENATRLDCFTPRVEAAESQSSAEVATPQVQLETSVSRLSKLRQEMQNELADLRSASQEHSDATDAFQLAVSVIDGLNEAASLRAKVTPDIETKGDITAMQLTDRLRDLEHKSIIYDISTPRVRAVESPLQSPFPTPSDGHKSGSRGASLGQEVQVGRIFDEGDELGTAVSRSVELFESVAAI